MNRLYTTVRQATLALLGFIMNSVIGPGRRLDVLAIIWLILLSASTFAVYIIFFYHQIQPILGVSSEEARESLSIPFALQTLGNLLFRLDVLFGIAACLLALVIVQYQMIWDWWSGSQVRGKIGAIVLRRFLSSASAFLVVCIYGGFVLIQRLQADALVSALLSLAGMAVVLVLVANFHRPRLVYLAYFAVSAILIAAVRSTGEPLALLISVLSRLDGFSWLTLASVSVTWWVFLNNLRNIVRIVPWLWVLAAYFLLLAIVTPSGVGVVLCEGSAWPCGNRNVADLDDIATVYSWILTGAGLFQAAFLVVQISDVSADTNKKISAIHNNVVIPKHYGDIIKRLDENPIVEKPFSVTYPRADTITANSSDDFINRCQNPPFAKQRTLLCRFILPRKSKEVPTRFVVQELQKAFAQYVDTSNSAILLLAYDESYLAYCSAKDFHEQLKSDGTVLCHEMNAAKHQALIQRFKSPPEMLEEETLYRALMLILEKLLIPGRITNVMVLSTKGEAIGLLDAIKTLRRIFFTPT